MTEHSFSDADLLAYLDGEVSEDLRRAIVTTPAALSRAAQLSAEQALFTRHLYRTTCPDSTLLGELALALLAPSDRAVLSDHLQVCPHCRAEVAQFEAFLAEPIDAPASATVSGLGRRLRLIVARLLEADGPTPALAGVRGDDSGPLLYEAEEAQISIEVQDDSAAGRRAVLGLVLGAETAGWEAQLRRGDATVSRTNIDELGNFSFHDLLPGVYALLLQGPDVLIRIDDLDV